MALCLSFANWLLESHKDLFLGLLCSALTHFLCGAILRHHKLNYHIYADDTQVYCSTDLSNPQEELRRITACVSDIRTWMVRNKLKINDDKTEFLILYSSYKEFTIDLEFEIGQTKIKPSNTCRNLGVMFDSNMKMESQIQNICKTVNFHLRSINAVRNSLTNEATVLLVHALITSRLDYCNSFLQGFARQTNQPSPAPSEHCC